MPRDCGVSAIYRPPICPARGLVLFWSNRSAATTCAGVSTVVLPHASVLSRPPAVVEEPGPVAEEPPMPPAAGAPPESAPAVAAASAATATAALLAAAPIALMAS